MHFTTRRFVLATSNKYVVQKLHVVTLFVRSVDAVVYRIPEQSQTSDNHVSMWQATQHLWFNCKVDTTS